MTEFIGYAIVLVPLFVALMYGTSVLDRVFRDMNYKGSAQEIYEKGQQAGYQRAHGEFQYQTGKFLEDFKKNHFPKMLGKFENGAEFLFERDCSYDFETGEVTGVSKYYRLKPIALRLEIRPRQELHAVYKSDAEARLYG